MSFVIALARVITSPILVFYEPTKLSVAPTRGSGIAVAAMVIAGIVTAGVVLTQVYVILIATGFCALDGC